MRFRIQKRWDSVWGPIFIPQVERWFYWEDLSYMTTNEQEALVIIEKYKQHNTTSHVNT